FPISYWSFFNASNDAGVRNSSSDRAMYSAFFPASVPVCVLKVILKPFSVSRTLMSKANFLTCFVSKSSPPFISRLANGTTFTNLRHCQKHKSESSFQYAAVPGLEWRDACEVEVSSQDPRLNHRCLAKPSQVPDRFRSSFDLTEQVQEALIIPDILHRLHNLTILDKERPIPCHTRDSLRPWFNFPDVP